MSAGEDFASILAATDLDPAWAPLLLAICDAWLQAESTGISENEAQRWSPVCTAAAEMVV